MGRYIKISISVDGENIWHELKPKTEPTRGTEILTGIIDIPKYINEFIEKLNFLSTNPKI